MYLRAADLSQFRFDRTFYFTTTALHSKGVVYSSESFFYTEEGSIADTSHIRSLKLVYHLSSHSRQLGKMVLLTVNVKINF